MSTCSQNLTESMKHQYLSAFVRISYFQGKFLAKTEVSNVHIYMLAHLFERHVYRLNEGSMYIMWDISVHKSHSGFYLATQGFALLIVDLGR